MTRTGRFIIAAVIALPAVACGTSMPTAPSPGSNASTSTVAPDLSSAATALSAMAVSCTVDIGTTTRPFPALHVLAIWINASLPTSSLSCGQVRSLAAKLQQEVAALDQEPQNFHAACGVSGGLLSELEALVRNGSLATLTFPAPVPGAPTTVLGVATETNEHFCEAARE